MKTIIPGKQQSSRPWWVGKKVVCPCGFIGEIEEGDEKKPGFEMLAERCINGKRLISAPCPTCGGTASYDSKKGGAV
jgi:hypothetical protein